MSKDNLNVEAAKITTPENESTSTSTSTEVVKTEATTQAAASTSNVGIIEEALSTEVPTEPVVEEVPAEVLAPTEMEAYELELAEDSPLTDAEFDEVVLEAERLKLGKEDAEKLIKMREYSHKSSNEIFEKVAQERTENMVKEYKGDASLHTIEAKLSMRESIKAFGNTPEFKEMFKDPSMNFNVPLAKFLISVGDKIRSGQDTLPMKKGASVITNNDAVSKTASNFYKDM